MIDLNRQIAERLGWWVYHYDKDYRENCYYQLVNESFVPVVYAPNYYTGQRRTEAEAWADVPDFAGDREASLTLESIIDERGLGSQYAGALAEIVGPHGGLWDIIRATPEQRVRAALVVLPERLS